MVVDELGWEDDFGVLASILQERFDNGGHGRLILTSGQTMAELLDDHDGYGQGVMKRMLKAGKRKSFVVKAFPDEAS